MKWMYSFSISSISTLCLFGNFKTMKLFATIRRHFGVLGIHPTTNQQPKLFNLKNASVLLFIGQYFISSGLFLLFQSQTVNEYVYSFWELITSLGTILAFLSIILKKGNIFQLIDDCEVVIQRRSAIPTSKFLYENVMNKAEKLTNTIYFWSTKFSALAVVIPNSVISYYFFFTAGDGADSFRLPLPAIYPFDWKTPVGFSVAVAIQTVSQWCLVHIFHNIMCLYVALCWMIIAFLDDIDYEFQTLNQTKIPGQSMVGHREFLKKFNDIVQFHSDTKQFTYRFVNVYKYIITLNSLWSILAICSTLLAVQIEISNNEGNPFETVQSLTLSLWAFGLIFFFCYFGQCVTTRFEELINRVYLCDWYSFPIVAQRQLPFIIAVFQKPVAIKGFGNVYYTREAFKQIVNGGFSYFIVLRRT